MNDMAAGEIETVHPSYLGSQDTFCAGTLKGVGRIYEQTFIGTYAKVGFAKLYTARPSITAAGLFVAKVLPFTFGKKSIRTLKHYNLILTCG